MVLIVWFKTHAFIEYTSLLKLKKLFKIDKYEEEFNMGLYTDYPSFLALNYDNFFVRLITCVYCLSFWLSLICAYFYGIQFMPLVMICSLIIYGLVNSLLNYGD